MEIIGANSEVYMGGEQVSLLMYANDIVLLGPDEAKHNNSWMSWATGVHIGQWKLTPKKVRPYIYETTKKVGLTSNSIAVVIN